MMSMSTSNGKLIKVAVGNFALISQRLDWEFVVRASIPKLSTAGLRGFSVTRFDYNGAQKSHDLL